MNALFTGTCGRPACANTISSYVIDQHGYAQGPTTIKSSGQTPYGFGLTKDGSLIVSEAFGGAMGAAAASSYAVSGAGELTMMSGSVGDTRGEVCWVALTKPALTLDKDHHDADRTDKGGYLRLASISTMHLA